MKPLGVFVAVLAAVSVAVFIFFPERFPPGWGFERTPITSITYWSSADLSGRTTFLNPTEKTLYNVTVVCRNIQLHQSRIYVIPICRPRSSFSIGCEDGWCWKQGETYTISASTYREGFCKLAPPPAQVTDPLPFLTSQDHDTVSGPLGFGTSALKVTVRGVNPSSKGKIVTIRCVVHTFGAITGNKQADFEQTMPTHAHAKANFEYTFTFTDVGSLISYQFDPSIVKVEASDYP